MDRSKYIKHYKEIYKGVSPNNTKKATALIEKLADILCMMDECKMHLDEEGCVTEMSQGSYSIQRENPWSKVYDSKAKLMISIIDKLDKLLPDAKTEKTISAGNALGAFVSSGKGVETR